MAEKQFVYDGVISGKKVISWTVPLVKMIDPETGKEKLAPDTHECHEWWKANFTKENGAFWYKTGEVSVNV